MQGRRIGGSIRYMFRSLLFIFGTLFVVNVYPDVNDRINIFVSVPPQKFLVERIGGEHVSVSVMLRPGYSPETYEPSPKEMAALSRSQLYFRVGVPFENIWMDVITAVNSDLKIIECCNQITNRDLTNHKEKNINSYQSEMVDPHIWTSPANAKLLAQQIKEVLIEEDPDQQQFYQSNYQLLSDELNELDNFIHSKLSDVRMPYILVSHPSWGYYAERYGLVQISLENNGKEKGPRGLIELIEFAKKKNIPTLFRQRQFKTASTVTLADEINANIIEIDPLAEDYIVNLREVTRVFAEATR